MSTECSENVFLDEEAEDSSGIQFGIEFGDGDLVFEVSKFESGQRLLAGCGAACWCNH